MIIGYVYLRSYVNLSKTIQTWMTGVGLLDT